ncbi:MAG: YceI family protein [Flavobacteriales bacterium]|nr:YceI family protein [Flavobacteriales bacterium]
MKILTWILLTLIPAFGLAQQDMHLTDESSVSIYGTSNVHDWSEHCEAVKGTIQLTQEGDEIDLEGLNFKVQVTDIKSGKNTMDNYTYEALLEEEYPTITFKSTEVTTSGSPLSLKVVADGKLTIAGNTQTERINASCTYSPYGLKCSGVKVVDMTKFGIEPPSVMFGAMTVGKEVEIHYEIEFK